MNTAKSIAALMLVIASSSALAEGGSDRLHGKMIQANEQAMRAYAAANGKKPPEVIHYRYGMKRKRPANSPCVSQAGTH